MLSNYINSTNKIIKLSKLPLELQKEIENTSNVILVKVPLNKNEPNSNCNHITLYHVNKSTENLSNEKKKVDALKLRLQELKSNLQQQKSSSNDKNMIKLLHEYNEIKDVGQLLLGSLS